MVWASAAGARLGEKGEPHRAHGDAESGPWGTHTKRTRRLALAGARLIGGAQLRDAIKGSDFITRLRLDWVFAFRDEAIPTPEVVQLLGLKDEYVTVHDSNDITLFKDAKLFTLAGSATRNGLSAHGRQKPCVCAAAWTRWRMKGRSGRRPLRRRLRAARHSRLRRVARQVCEPSGIDPGACGRLGISACWDSSCRGFDAAASRGSAIATPRKWPLATADSVPFYFSDTATAYCSPVSAVSRMHFGGSAWWSVSDSLWHIIEKVRGAQRLRPPPGRRHLLRPDPQ